MKLSFFIGLLIGILLHQCFFFTKEGITNNDNSDEDDHTKFLYDRLMSDFDTIFPSRNRNAGGPQWYHHIVSMNPTIEEFKKLNQFYCAVSGSPIDPSRGKTYDSIKVKGLDDKYYYGKYYRCCWPCLCDIMRDDLVVVEPHTITLQDGDNAHNVCYPHHVLTIRDPCINEERIPDEITSFNCDQGRTQNGLHSESGRLIIGVLHEAEEYTNQDINDISEMCKERINTPIDELQGGMGDISVKMYNLK